VGFDRRAGIEQATNEVARFEVYAWVDVYRLIARLWASIIVLGLHHASSAGAASFSLRRGVTLT
jgi:hypothetical protein